MADIVDELQAQWDALKAQDAARQQDASQYRDIASAQSQGNQLTQQGANLSDVMKMRAVAGTDFGSVVNALSGKPQTADRADAVTQPIVESGGAAPRVAGENLPSDLERYMPGVKAGIYKEIPSGNQRLIIDQQGNPVATRDEMPSVADSWAHRGENGNTTFGAIANTLGAGVRVPATAAAYLAEVLRGKPVDYGQAARDIFINAPAGNTEQRISSGGHVASQFGDVLDQGIKNDPNAEIGSVLGALGGVSSNTKWADLPQGTTELIATPGNIVGDLTNMLPVDRIPAILGGQIAKRAPGLTKAVLDSVPGKLVQTANLAGIGNLGETYRKLGAGVPPEEIAAFLAATKQAPVEAASTAAGWAADRGASRVRAAGAMTEDEAKMASEILSPSTPSNMQPGLPRLQPKGSRGIAEDLAAIADNDVAKSLPSDVQAKIQAVKAGMQPEALQAAGEAAVKAHPEFATTMTSGQFQEVFRKGQQDFINSLVDKKVTVVDAYNKVARHEKLPELSLFADHPFDTRPRFRPGETPESFNRRVAAAEAAHGSLSPEARALAESRARAAQGAHEIAQQRQLDFERPGAPDANPHADYVPIVNQGKVRTFLEEKGVPKFLAKFAGTIAAPFEEATASTLGHARSTEALGSVGPAMELARTRDAAVRLLAEDGKAMPANLAREDAARFRPIALGADEREWLSTFTKEKGFQTDPAVIDHVQGILREHGDNVPKASGGVSAHNAEMEQQRVIGKWSANTAAPKAEEDIITALAHNDQGTQAAQRRGVLDNVLANMTDSSGNNVVRKIEDFLSAPGKYQTPVPESLANHVSTAKRTGEAIADETLHVPDLKTGGSHLDPVLKKYLDENGMRYISSTKDGITKEIAQQFPQMANKVVPVEVFDTLEKMVSRLTNPTWLDRAVTLFSKATALWVPLALNTPGFHIRNWLTGMFQMALHMGHDAFNPRLQQEAHLVARVAAGSAEGDTLIKIGNQEWRAADLADFAKRQGTFEGGRIADATKHASQNALYSDQNIRRGLQRIDPTSQRGFFTGGLEPDTRKISEFLGGPQSLYKGGATSENVQRLMVFLHEMKGGASPVDAARAVIPVMFDYTGSRLSGAEKNLRQLVPFYQWTRYATEQVVKTMLSKPQRWAQLDHIVRTMHLAMKGSENYDPRETPEWAQQTAGFQAPSFLGKTDAEHRYNLNVGEVPGASTMAMLDSPSSAIDNLGIAPTLAVQRFTGKYLHGGNTIDPGYSPDNGANTAIENIAGMTKENIMPYAGRSLAAGYLSLPASSVLGNGSPRRSDADETSRSLARAASLLTGVRLSSYDPNATLNQAAQSGKNVLTAEEAHQKTLGKNDLVASPGSKAVQILDWFKGNMP